MTVLFVKCNSTSELTSENAKPSLDDALVTPVRDEPAAKLTRAENPGPWRIKTETSLEHSATIAGRIRELHADGR